MASCQFSEATPGVQAAGVPQIAAILETVDSTTLLKRLRAYRPVGRKGYSLEALWRAYLASFILDLPHTNALIRRLQDDAELRQLCGFDQLPHRTTFNRFISRLSKHVGLVEGSLRKLTNQLARKLPDFGEKVAVDSTVVRTHSNPNRKKVSDPEASWTAKNSAKAKDGKEFYFGYKYHAAVDATYGVPITGYTTTASRQDTRELPKLLDKARQEVGDIGTRYVIADKGYDSEKNHRAVRDRDAVPIIAIRKVTKRADTQLQEGIYTDDGRPTCMGMIPMEYVRSDPERGHLYRCAVGGCHLKARKGVRYCDDEVWVNRKDNLRLFGQVRRDSKEWKALYRQRQAVERVFKSLKESRRLERHCVRGLKKVALHVTMSVLAFQATALIHVLAGEEDELRWMVRKVA